MKTTNPNFDARHYQRFKRPVYRVTFDGVNDAFTNARRQGVNTAFDGTVHDVDFMPCAQSRIEAHPAGHLAIAQNADGLNYFTGAESNWIKEVVDSYRLQNVFGLFFNGDTPHIIYSRHYLSFNSYELRHAYKAGGSWQFNTITPNATRTYPGCCKAFMDHNGKLHVVYVHNYDYTLFELRYGTNASGAWKTETIATLTGGEAVTEIHVDASGKVHIFYGRLDISGGDYIDCYSGKPGAWTAPERVLTLPGNRYLLSDSNLCVDKSGVFHLFVESSDIQMGYVIDALHITGATGAWHEESIVLPDTGNFRFVNCVMDGADKIHIVAGFYHAYNDNEIRYYNNVGGSFKRLGALATTTGSAKIRDFKCIGDGVICLFAQVVQDSFMFRYACLVKFDYDKPYLKSISGLSQRISPEEGKSTIGGVTISLLDVKGEITALISSDPNYFHRKRVSISAGYDGLALKDFLRVFTGWITGIALSSDGGIYNFTATDPQKWMQAKVFKKSEKTPAIISGNPLNILLAMMTSTGTGKNGRYDWYPAANGLAIPADIIDISSIETIRDKYYPGNSHYMWFNIKKREKAVDWLEKEIFKPLNVYPVIDGQGRFTVLPFRPPVGIGNATVQSFSDDNIIGVPSWDMNLAGMINEIEFFYDFDGKDFLSSRYEINALSKNARGNGSKVLKIESKGWHSDKVDVSAIINRRTNAVFGRYSIPPIKIKLKTFFDRWLTEVGDIVPVTHKLLPDMAAGTRKLFAQRVEVINRSVDWANGSVSLELLDTGFGKAQYGVVSPVMTITAVTDNTRFTVSIKDARKFSRFSAPVVQVCDVGMRQQVASVTLLSVNVGNGVVTCDPMGLTPKVGWKVLFADYDHATAEQKQYSFIADGLNHLGSANKPANLITP